MSRKLIAIVGATGSQGGAVAKAILADASGEFAVRALTRNPESAAAKALQAAGCEVVAASLDDEASLTTAFTGCYGAFCMTDRTEVSAQETIHATHMAHAAKAAGLQHVVWSTLDESRTLFPLSDPTIPTLQGKYKVPHFDAKADGNKAFEESGVPTTFLQTSFFCENFTKIMPLYKTPTGAVLTLPMPSAKLALVTLEDLGNCTLAIFKRGGEFQNKMVSIASDQLTGAELAAQLSAALGLAVSHQPLSFEAYRQLGFPGAEDYANMFQFYCLAEETFCGLRNPAVTKGLYPKSRNFKEWLADNASKILIQ